VPPSAEAGWGGWGCDPKQAPIPLSGNHGLPGWPSDSAPAETSTTHPGGAVCDAADNCWFEGDPSAPVCYVSGEINSRGRPYNPAFGEPFQQPYINDTGGGVREIDPAHVGYIPPSWARPRRPNR
jgi:hypothetical protein